MSGKTGRPTAASNSVPMPQTFDKIPDVDLKTASQDGPSESNNQSKGINVSQGVVRHNTAEKDANVNKGSHISTLPPEKVFSIQLGSELFRLSGASIESDGQLPVAAFAIRTLRILEHLHTSLDFSKSSFDRLKMAET